MQKTHLVFAAAMLLLGAMGCDPAVDYFQENDLHYSIFGYLNASADTQFVRVEPLRDGMLLRVPETPNADVTLTELATERTAPLQDSLFYYLGEATAQNFYTTFEIKPSTTYRLTVQGANGTHSQTQVSVPARFPTPTVAVAIPEGTFPSCIRNGSNRRTAVVEVEGIERLVAVRAIYYMADPKGTWSFGHLADTVQTGNDVIRAQINYGRDMCRIPDGDFGMKDVEKIEVIIAAGNPDWPDFMGLDLETETLPGVASNVEGGVGLLGGIVTDTVTVYPYH